MPSFCNATMRAQDGRLLRTWRAGSEAKYNAYLEDYAFLAGCHVFPSERRLKVTADYRPKSICYKRSSLGRGKTSPASASTVTA